MLKYKIFGLSMLLSIAVLGQKKSTLFELVPSKKTGVTFNNKIQDIRDANILIYSNFYGGGGVGVADFNKDGLIDLFFAGNQVDDVLYLNKGNFRFDDITKKAGITSQNGWSSGVVIADVNADGYPDIYVTRELYDDDAELRKNKLYINQKDLTFKEMADEYGVADSGRTRHATFLDYNRDGLLDLFLLTQPPNPGNYSPLLGTNLKDPKYRPVLLENTGNKFVDVTERAGLTKVGYPNSVAAADLNQDGFTDLYISNDFDAPDFLYINKGDGTFEETIQESVNHISFFSMGVDAADVTNNGLLDLMVLDMVAEDNFRLKANMSGMDVSAFWKVVDNGGHYQYMFNTLHLNHGSSVFSEVGQMAGISATDWSWSNLIADFDNDGWKDIHITNGLMRDIRNTDSSKEFPKYVTKVINEYIQKNPNDPDVTILDILNLDEALALVPSQKIPNYSYKNLGDLEFENTSKDWGVNQESFSTGSAYADLDNDGDLDLIVNNINDEVFLYRNTHDRKSSFLRIKLEDPSGATTLGSKVTLHSSEGIQFFETMNVRGMYSTSEDIVHFGFSNDTQIHRVHIEWPDGTVSEYGELGVNELITIKKENSEKKEELASSEPFTKKELISYSHSENIFDDYTHQVLLPHKMSQMGPALAKGDVNGDGLEDVFVGGAAGQPAALFFQQQDGTFLKDQNKRWESDRLYEDVNALLFDFENDGDLDLYVVSGGNAGEVASKFYLDRMYLNNGEGRFVRANLIPQIGASGSVVRAADFDNDGDLDLFLGSRHVPRSYPEAPDSYILINDQNRYWDRTSEILPALSGIGMVTDALWSDYDGDNDLDLLVVGEWMSVQIFDNDNGKLTPSVNNSMLASHTGWLSSIKAVDIENDGDLDYVVGNLGLNYKYKATYQEPFDVYYYDFDDNGNKDIVLAYYNEGEQFPVRGRSCSIQQVPTIAQKFDSYDTFASSTLEDIYEIDKIDDELYLSAQNFSHFVLKNNGKGQFTISELPRMSQLTSINDWVVTDLNGDGISDLIGAGGIFQAEIETQRNDASTGIVLLGNGKGYDLVPFEKSKLYLKYDTKNLEIITIKEKDHLLVGNNDAPLEILEIIGLED